MLARPQPLASSRYQTLVSVSHVIGFLVDTLPDTHTYLHSTLTDARLLSLYISRLYLYHRNGTVQYAINHTALAVIPTPTTTITP